MREKVKNNKVLQIINKILKFISWVVLIALLILAGFLIYYVVMAKQAEKKGADYKPPMALYTIISPSMVPNINVYDVVFNVKVNDPNTLEVGDIITFVSSDSYMKGMIITHRIVDKYVTNEGVQFKTKGDANVEADSSLVYEENVIGKVLFKIPQLGRVQFFLASKSGWFIAILIPALAVIAYDIFKLFRLLILKKQLKNKDEDDNNGSGKITEEDGEKVLDLTHAGEEATLSTGIAEKQEEKEPEYKNEEEDIINEKENSNVEKEIINEDIPPIEPTPKDEVDISPTIDIKENTFDNSIDNEQTNKTLEELLNENAASIEEEKSEEQKEKDAIIEALVKGNMRNNKK